ncbi:MAG: hypothetical protein WA432_00730, partial [Candidatus Babeliaceae bacterium]
ELALGSWDVHEYRLQWKEGLERLKTYNTSCLVVCVQDLQDIPFIERWELYKENTIVYFHQQFIIPPIAQVINFSFPLSEFSRTNCYERIPPRKVNENNEAVNEQGQLLVEWSVEYKAIEEFSHSFEPVKDEYFKMRYKEDKNPPFNHNKPAFKKGDHWIIPDRDRLKGGVWKSITKNGQRLATLDANLDPIAD